MSVAKELGVAHPEDQQLHQARRRWALWVAQDPAIGVVGDLLDLPAWVRGAHPADSDRVLLGLADLGAPDGADDLAAVGALTWLLLPGASLLARDLRCLTGRIDELVASQLWLEARTFGPTRSRHKVAANILMNTRKGVLRELGIGKHLARADPTWYRTTTMDPTSDEWREIDQVAVPTGHDHGEGLDNLLAEAVQSGAVRTQDCELLWSLADEARQQQSTHGGHGSGGLMGVAVSDAVAQRRGVTGRTVRRHGSHALAALRQSCQPMPAISA